MALRNLAEIDPKNIRQTVVPLAIDLIKEFFEKKDLFFVVNYGKSQVKGSMFLTYISNLDLPCEISLTEATKQEKFDLVKIYMETRNMNNSDVLKLTVADVILTYKGVDTKDMFTNPVFSSEEKSEFISQHTDLIKKWDQFLYSTLIFLVKSFPDLNEVLKVETQVTEIDDPNFIGLNVVNLFGIPNFCDFFFATQAQEELCYFKPQFEEYMFKGKNFFHYFNCEENTFILLMSAMLNGKIKPEDLVELVKTEGMP